MSLGVEIEALRRVSVEFALSSGIYAIAGLSEGDKMLKSE